MAHILTFLLLIRPKVRSCNHVPPDPLPTLPVYWDYTDPEGMKKRPTLSYRERCVRINIDNWIAGGFDVGTCTVLVALHIWVLVKRVWGCGDKGKEDTERARMADLENGKVKVENVEMIELDERSSVLERAPASRRGSKKSASREGVSVKWTEVVLECLVGET